MSRRYPLEPLFALTGWSHNAIRALAPCAGPEYKRRQTEGVTELIADRLASTAGLHPFEVWPEMAEHAIEDISRTCEGCGITYPPHWKTQRYCRPQCAKNASERRKREADPNYVAKRNEARRRYYAEAGDYERARQRRYDRARTEAA